MRKRIQSVLLTVVLFIGLLAPATNVSAEPAINRGLAEKCGLKPFTVIEMPQQEGVELPPIENVTTAQISVADRKYWTQFNSDYYYYYFLNDAEKAFWDELEEGCIALATTTQDSSIVYADSAPTISEERKIDLMFLFTYCHPQYYFISSAIGWSGSYGFLYLYDEFIDGDVRMAATNQFTARMDVWMTEVEAQNRPEEKVKRAHDIVCQNTIYNPNDYDQSAYSLVCMGQTVCAGYSKTMQMLLNAVGIDSLTVTSPVHAWNIVQLHGVWYELDATWDDGDEYGIFYDFYNKSRQTFVTSGSDGSHDIEAIYQNMRVDAPYDMPSTAWEYVSPYFTADNISYVILNENTGLAERLVKPLDTSVGAPLTVNQNGKTYQVIGGTAEVGGEEDSSEQVMAFVERMYTVALGRDAEASGANYWAKQLLAGENDGAGIARGFFLSPEFMNSGHSNNEYVKRLYRTFFDREPAEEEVNYWMGKLANGESREFVLSGFVNSNEFDVLCGNFGISRGFLRQNGAAINPGISQFAERLYTKVLERAGEKDGIEYWTLQIADGVCTPDAAAKSFFKSPEYLNKKSSNTHYIEACYRTFMGREPEEGGVVYWKNVMANGATRDEVLAGFAASAEFQQILKEYGL